MLVQRSDGLGRLLLKVAHLGQLSVLLLRDAGHGLGIIDNLAQPGALLRLGVGNTVGQQLLALEGTAHQFFGAGDFLPEAGDLLIAVLGARKLQLLLGATHRGVGLQQGAAGAGAQLFQGNLRDLRTRNRAGSVIGVLLRGVFATLAATSRVHATTNGSHRTDSQHTGHHARRATALLSLDPLDRGQRRAGVIAVLQLRLDVVLVHLRLLIARQGLRATGQEIRLTAFGGNHQHHVGRAPVVLRGQGLGPRLGTRGVLKLIDGHHVQVHVVLLRQSRNLGTQRGGIAQGIRGVVDAGTGNLHGVSGLRGRGAGCGKERRTGRSHDGGEGQTCCQRCGTHYGA